MYNTIEDIKAANRRAGYYFFEPSSMRFFNSRILKTVYQGKYFITSEQFVDGSYREPRKYTIRECTDTGDIRTVGKFNAIASLREAKKIAQSLQ